MASRVRAPESHRIDLSDGDWILVKKHLNAGEKRKMLGLMMGMGVKAGEIDPTRVGLAKILTYLLDWSFKGLDDKLIPVMEQSQEDIEAALDSIEPESFTEGLKGIERHDAEMETLRAAEKNGRATGNASSPISPSVAS